MGSKRIYSDSGVGQIISNITSMLGSTPEEALQKAELAHRIAQIDKSRGEVDSYNNVADLIGGMHSPEDIVNNAFNLYSAHARGGGNGSDLANTLQGLAGAAGASNDRMIALHGGSGHAIGENQALTGDGQRAIRSDNERVQDEIEAAKLANAFSINQVNEGGRNARYDRQPISLSPGEEVHFNDKIFQGHATPTTVRGGIMEDVAGGTPATDDQKAALALGNTGSGTHVALDVSPADADAMDGMIGDILGDGAEDMDPTLRQRLLQRSTEIYQSTRNAQTAVGQAVKELTQTTETPTYMGFGTPKKSFVEREADVSGDEPDPFGGQQVAPVDVVKDPFDASTNAAPQPETTPLAPAQVGGAVAEGTIQRKMGPDGQYIYRIIRNGKPEPYTP